MTDQPPLWDAQRLRDPHETPDKSERVRGMFAAIARRYDLNNRLHSMWRDQAWRRLAVRTAEVSGDDVVLDVACGTGDLAIAFGRAGAAKVIGLDFTIEMLRVAEGKTPGMGSGGTAGDGDIGSVNWLAGDAMALPFADESVDIVSIAFGIRNVAEPMEAAAEFYRVLRPGGRLIILEFSQPGIAPLRWAYNFYFQRVMPVTAGWIAGDRVGAYRYLPRSVDTFMTPARIQAMLREVGFAETGFRSLSLGIAACHRALKR